MFKKIEIKNYKSIKNATIHLNNVNILIGPNNSGKSNLLDFIDFYQTILSFELKEAFGPRPFDFRDIVCMASDFRTDAIEGSFISETREGKEITHEYGIENFRNSKGRFGVRFKHEHVSLNGDNQSYTDRTVSILNEQYRNRSIANQNLYEYVRECRSIRRFQFSPKLIKKEEEIDIALPDIPFLRYSGENLIEVLFHIRDHNPENYRKIVNDFRSIFPDITDISFKHLGEQRYGLSFNKKTSKGSWQLMAPQISDGLAITLAILTLINSAKPPRFILMEEIENGINPNTLRILFEKIVSVSNKKGIQFFITTHSPILLELMSDNPEYVIVCEQKDGQSEYLPLNELLLKFGSEYQHGESLFHLWFNGLIGGL